MTKIPINIDQMRIATPCPIAWEQMTGDERVRFCAHCQLNVYNISELSRTETERLVASTEGRLCARLFRRADGTVLTKDCPVGIRALRRRVAKRTAAIFAAVVSLSAAAFGQQSSENGQSECTPQTRITRSAATSNPNEKILSGSVVDPLGAAIPGAKVKLINADAEEIWETSADADGRFAFASIDDGSYSLKIESVAFKTLEVKDVTVEKDKLTSIDMIMEFSVVATSGVVSIAPSLIDTPRFTTIIDEKMIQSLPFPK